MSPEITILYHDPNLIVVNKPPGIDVHGHDATDQRSLISHLAKQLGVSPEKLHPASRLDRPVSGAVPIVRTKLGRRSLTQQYQRRAVQRRYMALVQGVPSPPRGLWEAAIGLDRHNPRMRSIEGRDARSAKTKYTVREVIRGAWALVELSPHTGRTHQLRVHLSQVARCPILGDRRYGGPAAITMNDGSVVAVDRVMLHAARLALSLPSTGEPLTVEAPLWPDLEALLATLMR